MKTLLKLLLFPLFFFLSVSIYGQGSIVVANTNLNDQSDWQVYKHLDSADIYYKNTNCKLSDDFSFQYMLFKVVNTSNHLIEIAWEFKLYNNNQEIVKSPDDMQIQLTIEANSTQEGSCQGAGNNKLKILVSEQNNPSLITSIDLMNISVK
jgi:hypothetical protein